MTPPRSVRRALTLAACVAALGASAAPAAAKPACALLTSDEVAKAVGHAVTVDPHQSGSDANGGDHCVWVSGGEVAIELSLEPPTTDPSRAAGAYRELRDDAFGSGAAPTAVTGLGDEALYRDFEKVQGGAIVVRKGLVVLGLSGTQTKDAILSLARSAVGRL